MHCTDELTYHLPIKFNFCLILHFQPLTTWLPDVTYFSASINTQNYQTRKQQSLITGTHKKCKSSTCVQNVFLQDMIMQYSVDNNTLSTCLLTSEVCLFADKNASVIHTTSIFNVILWIHFNSAKWLNQETLQLAEVNKVMQSTGEYDICVSQWYHYFLADNYDWLKLLECSYKHWSWGRLRKTDRISST